MYKVIKFFTDLQDNNHPYQIGDEFPRKGMTVLATRFKELASSENRQGEPLIEEIIEVDEKPKKEKKTKSADKADEE
jgi:hypothetical protein